MRIRLALLGVILIVCFFPWTASAQPAVPAVDLFGGYSVLPADGDDFPRGQSHGFQVSASANLTPWFALFAELGMHFDTASDLGPNFEGLTAETRVTEYLAGPRFVARSDRFSLFAHGLLGYASGDAGEAFSGFSDTKLAFGGGVGADVDVTRRLGVRMQFDLLGSFADIVEGNTRFAVGLVARLGGS